MDADETERVTTAVRDWSAHRRMSVTLRILEQPPLFDIEAASACNITCSFCPREEMGRPMRLMDDPTFDAVERFLPDGATVMFSGLGDSLLNPRLESFIARLRARSISACLITNGLLLDAARQDALVGAGISEIQVSVHGMNSDGLRTIVTRGLAPERVRSQMERLAEVRPPSLRVRVNFVETPENAAEREVVATWATSLGFRFFHRRLHSRGGTVASLRTGTDHAGCGIFAAVTFVTVEGHVHSCVNDVRGDDRLGHVSEMDWAGLVARKRTIIESNAWFPHCRSCNDDYRWVILGQHGVDDPALAPARGAR